MSFDLFVLAEKFDAGTQSAWVERLRQHGVSCTLPPGFVLDHLGADNMAKCALVPPLVAAPLPAEDVGLAVGVVKADPEDIAELRGAATPELARRLEKVTLKFHFESGAGRSDASLLLQCYGAAALADVTDGVLIDPQEGSTVHGPAVYDVAKANSDWALPKPAEKSWWQRWFGG